MKILHIVVDFVDDAGKEYRVVLRKDGKGGVICEQDNQRQILLLNANEKDVLAFLNAVEIETLPFEEMAQKLF